LSDPNRPTEELTPVKLELQSDSSALPSFDTDATLDAPGSTAADAPEAYGSASAPKTIGDYRLVKKLGEGGMGQVWLAEQTAPVRRQVALKLIRAGMFDEALLQRFQSERQSLAIMDHPTIAKIFDAGTTPDGQPYFVMEYVPGLPITEYCDQKRLRVAERLELFIKVCEGVQHAHQKAIIHRDLKPANILIVDLDGKPVPRIIDFGLAKATTPQLAGETMFTQVGAFVGTPGYMSPEQTDSGVQDVDTRTDVYALGVVLYVLLTGSLPFDTKQWKKQPLHEVLRHLREDDPPRPSAKIGIEKESSSANAESRGVQPKQLASLLHGDLDWITMKALEKDRARRYGTPSELAGDITRYLRHEPVAARPASKSYRLQKYVRRHRVGVVVAAGLLLLLAGFAVAQEIQLRRIIEERDRTARERDRANRITEFMTSMFKVSDPSEGRGNSVTAREILDKASQDIDTGLTKDPELQAEMMNVMGKVYDNLGLYPRAEPLLQRSLKIRRSMLGPEHPDTLKSMENVAWVLKEEGHLTDAEKMEKDTLETRKLVLGRDNAETLGSMNDLADTLYEEGRYDEAGKLYQQTIEIQLRVLGPEDLHTVTTMGNLATTLHQQGRYSEAESWERKTLDIQSRILGPEHPNTLWSISSLASTLRSEGHLAESEKLYREAVEIQRRILGPEHADTLESMGGLAETISAEGRYSDAEKLEREVFEVQRRVFGAEHPDTLNSMSNLASSLYDEGHYVAAEKMQREALKTARRVLNPEHPQVLWLMDHLGLTLQKEGHYAEAENLHRDALESERHVLGPEYPQTLQSMSYLALTRQLEGHNAEAERSQRETLDIQRRVLGSEDSDTLESMSNLAATLAAEGRYSESEKLFRETFEIRRRVLGPEHPTTAETLYNLACVAAISGDRDEALSLLREAIDHGLSSGYDLELNENNDLKSLDGDPRFVALLAHAKEQAVLQKPN